MGEENLSTGTVKWFNEGQAVSFDLEQGRNGKTAATNVQLA